MPGKIKNRAKPNTPHAKGAPKGENINRGAPLRPGENGEFCFIARLLYHTSPRLSSVFCVFRPTFFVSFQKIGTFNKKNGNRCRFFYTLQI